MLRNHVQNVANANPCIAKVVITSAQTDIKNSSTHGKRQNSTKNSIEKGSVDLTAKGAGAHD
jgi:hypothetical protein